MKTLYREMFDGVHASKRLKEEVMNMTKQERTQAVKKLSVSFILVAALAVLLAGTALAAVIGVPQTLQEWFGQQWTESNHKEEMPVEQAAVIESMVQPVGVTCSGYGVTVTLDSVTPGENGLWMFLKVKGEKLADPWQFVGNDLNGTLREQENPDETKLAAGLAVYPMGNTEEGEQNLVILYDAPQGVSFLEGGRLELRLNDIVLLGEMPGEGGEVTDSALLKGTWALPFILEPVENRNELTAKGAKVPCGWEDPPILTEIRDIRVTVTGVRFTEVGAEKRPEDDRSTTRFDIALQMKGGLEVKAVGGAMPGAERRYNWPLPVDMSKVESIRFGDVVIPLEQSEE